MKSAIFLNGEKYIIANS